MAHTVLISRPLPLPPIEADGEPINFVVWDRSREAPKNARAILATFMDPVDKAMINALPESVGLVANFGIGTDHIDIEAANARGITVSNTPVVTEDTADLAFGLILSACRNIPRAERYLRAGQWEAKGPEQGLSQSVHGKTLGIIGFGAIGQAVARRARGFNMDIIYYNRSRKPDAEAALGAIYANLDAVLEGADIISLHTPLTPDTQYIIDAEALAKCKQGAVIINTGRGGLIDEAALIAALKSGHIASAGLDVFEGEPAVNPEFLGMDNVVLTPHIGSATTECRTAMMQRAAKNIITFLMSGNAVDVVG